MDSDKLDLSALDPAGDPARWEALVRRTVARSIAVRRRASIPALVARWARPALAAAASLALVSWGTVYFTAPPAASSSQSASDPASALVRWAETGKLPDTASLLNTLGGGHER